MRDSVKTFALNTAVAAVLTAMIWPRMSHGGWESFGRLFLSNLVISQCIGWLCHGVLTWASSRIWGRGWFRWPLYTLILLVVGLAGTMAATLVLKRFFGWGHYWRAVWEIYQPAAVVTLVVGFTAAVLAAYSDRLRISELESSAARLASLESRIQPHFLFNALNSIASLIREDPERAERVVGQLSSLLRSSLDAQEFRLVPLEREWKLVEDYLAIQQVRFGERLRFSLNLPPSLAGALIPPFCIQTLVENSVKHAVSARREGAMIRVSAEARVGRLQIAVTDDGPGFSPGVALPAGHGLDNLRRRLTSLFGGAAALILEGNCAMLDLPWEGLEPRARLSAG